ncbi:MAG: FAD-binding oxidoreductase, partial [Cyanothece sp. SIO2G6]|nr:FAD-binding oxidoreductase [Cyanothece sp. SIO2G6]
GIITELEMPLGPTYPWAEYIVTFADFMTAAHFGRALGNADGIIKKLISVYAWPIPQYFGPFQSIIPDGAHCAFLMVAQSCEEALAALVKEFRGDIVHQKGAAAVGKGQMLVEYGWNHTTLHARSVDPSLTYLQTLYPCEPDLATLEHLYHHFGDEVMVHLEFIRSNGAVATTGLQVVRYSTPERLQEIMAYHEAKGALIFNPHTYVMEDGGDRQIDPAKVNFKEKVDPYGLLNPGKMRGWEERR